MLIVVVEIYCRIQNWRRLRAAKEADADLDKFRPRTEHLFQVDVIHKLRARAHQAQDAGEPHLARDLRLASVTLQSDSTEKLNVGLRAGGVPGAD